ncbi:MAG: hypothetical protein AB8I08_18375 [Sandaracinaceae bacterium]
MIASSASAQVSEELAAPEEEVPEEGLAEEAAPPTPRDAAWRTSAIPPAPDLERDHLRLGIVLEDQAREASAGETFAGVALIGVGALELGAGLWLAFDDGTFASLDSLRWTAVALSIPLGVLSLVSGIASFSQSSVQGDRLRRWRLASEGRLDARQLGRFEGELRSDAETARVLRGFEAAAGFGVAGGGAALMLVTALSNADEIGQAYGYGVGAASLAAGLLSGLLTLLVESDAEEAWRNYLAGEPAGEPSGLDLSVSPAVSEDGFGVSLQGRF